jgi:hypothetical protein
MHKCDHWKTMWGRIESWKLKHHSLLPEGQDGGPFGSATDRA